MKRNQTFCYNWILHVSSTLTWRETLSQLCQRVLALTMQFAYKICITLYALLSVAWHWNFQRLFILNRRHCPSKNIFHMPFKWPLSFALKPEVDTSLKKIALENVLINLYCVWSNMVTLNKTHTMILVCAADDFRKYRENCRNWDLKKIIKNML